MTDTNENNVNNLHSPQQDGVNKEPNKSIDQEWKELQDKTATFLSNELEEQRNKYSELEDQYKRLWADQQNIVNRFNRERLDIVRYAASNTIEALLPALDNFDFAKRSINGNTKPEDIIKSIEMLQDQLINSLKSVGLELINTNNTFNPELHEAVHKVVDTSKPEGTILEVLKKGFKLNDKVIRVATVVVSTKE
jgi:molecular chaperone GrpE